MAKLGYQVICKDTEAIPRTEWLKLRKEHGVGASEVSAIAGVSSFQTPVDVFMDKISPVNESEEISLSQAYRFEYGHRLESLLLWTVAQLIGATPIHDKQMYVSTQYPYMFADLDGLLRPQKEIMIQGVRIPKDTLLLFEGKTTNFMNFEAWKETPPIGYVMQCKAAMLVRELDYALLVIGKGNNLEQDVVYHLVVLTEEDRKVIPQLVRSFWENNVLTQTPPSIPVGTYLTDYKRALVNYYHNRGVQEREKVLPYSLRPTLENAIAIREEISTLNRQVKELEGKRDEMELPLVTELGEDYTKGVLAGIYSNYEISYTRRNYETIPSDALSRLQDTHPELYEQLLEDGFVKRNSSASLSVKKKKVKARTRNRNQAS